MKSKFRCSAYVVALAGILFLVVSIALFRISADSDTQLWKRLAFIIFLLFIWAWMFFGELRTKIITIDIDYDKVRIKKYWGLGISKEYQIDDISGFKISILRSKNGAYEYLYLIADNKKIAKISEYYHSNYKDLKEFLIATGIPRLGIEQFSNRQEIRDIFSR